MKRIIVSWLRVWQQEEKDNDGAGKICQWVQGTLENKNG